MNTKNQIIPEFKFNSKELESFHQAHKYEQEYEFDSANFCGYNLPVISKGVRKLWKKSGIQYIVNHGNFRTLETSVCAQVNSLSEVIA